MVETCGVDMQNIMIKNTTHSVGTILDERSSRRKELYLTVHIIHKRRTSVLPAEFEPKISADERPQTLRLRPLGPAQKDFGLSIILQDRDVFQNLNSSVTFHLFQITPTNYIRSGEDDAHIGGQQIPLFC